MSSIAFTINKAAIAQQAAEPTEGGQPDRIAGGSFFHRPRAEERSLDKFQAKVAALYAPRGKPPLSGAALKQALATPEMEHAWAAWKAGETAAFPARITYVGVEKPRGYDDGSTVTVLRAAPGKLTPKDARAKLPSDLRTFAALGVEVPDLSRMGRDAGAQAKEVFTTYQGVRQDLLDKRSRALDRGDVAAATYYSKLVKALDTKATAAREELAHFDKPSDKAVAAMYSHGELSSLRAATFFAGQAVGMSDTSLSDMLGVHAEDAADPIVRRSLDVALEVGMPPASVDSKAVSGGFAKMASRTEPELRAMLTRIKPGPAIDAEMKAFAKEYFGYALSRGINPFELSMLDRWDIDVLPTLPRDVSVRFKAIVELANVPVNPAYDLVVVNLAAIGDEMRATPPVVYLDAHTARIAEDPNYAKQVLEAYTRSKDANVSAPARLALRRAIEENGLSSITEGLSARERARFDRFFVEVVLGSTASVKTLLASVQDDKVKHAAVIEMLAKGTRPKNADDAMLRAREQAARIHLHGAQQSGDTEATDFWSRVIKEKD